MIIGIEAYLLVAAALIAIGVYGALSQQSIVMLMMGLELMLNGVLLTVISFWYFIAPLSAKGQVFAIIVLTLMAIEAALGFAIIIALYRARQVDTVDSARDLHG